MMSGKQWLILMVFFIIYLLLGGVSFMYLEARDETTHREETLQLTTDINGKS